MKELPDFFVIRANINNPLWSKYITWLNNNYIVGPKLNGADKKSYYGYNKKLKIVFVNTNPEFHEDCVIITLEQWDEIVNGFVLPEKWCVEIKTKKEYEVVSCFLGIPDNWFSWINWQRCNLRYVFYDKTTDHNNNRYNLPEITFEQFKKHVLKQETMEKKIIRYKLKDGCEKYLPILDKISSYFSEIDDSSFHIYSAFYDNFKEAHVLDLWFEPIYGYNKPDITINGYKAEFFDTYVKFGCAEISKEVFLGVYGITKYTNTNREVESITIGKGIFSKEDIKQIVEYYELIKF